ncbi:hypothetical protein C0995_016392 [Termitomyces sp. Mi166|nr:hypothetical protein C0995_016392 [Termitomyces sp. Mi166\
MPTLDDKLYEEFNALIHWQFLVEGTVDHLIPLHLGNFTVDEYGDDPDAGASLSPSSIDIGIDTPAINPQVLHEHTADNESITYYLQGHQIDMSSPAFLSVTTPEGRIATKQQKNTNKVAPSQPKCIRRGELCPLGCSTRYPKYTGDRDVLKARYRKKRKSKQKREKEVAQVSNQIDIMTPSAWSPLDLAQVPTSNAVADGRASASINPAYAQEFPTYNFHCPMPPRGNSNAMNPTNGMSMLQSHSCLHPSAQVDFFLTQPRWDSFRATQVPTSTNGVGDGRTPAYAQESMNEVQATTVSKAHMPCNGNATYSIPFDLHFQNSDLGSTSGGQWDRVFDTQM